MKMKFFTTALAMMFLFVNSAHAVQYSSIYLSAEETRYFNSIAPCVTQTVHTQRIAEDERLGGVYVSALRNLERMVRSAEEGCGLQTEKLWRAIDRVNDAVNSGNPVPVFGVTPDRMKHFTDMASFYYGGR